MQLATRAQRVGIDFERVMRPGDHAGKLLTRAVVEGAEELESQWMLAHAGMIGKAVAYEVGVMLGLRDPVTEVSGDG